MTIGSVLARIGEIQSRFGLTSGLATPVVDAATFAGLSVDDLLDVVTEETEKIAGSAAAKAVEASLLEVLAVQRSDSGLTAVSSVADLANERVAERIIEYGGPTVFPLAGFEVGSFYGPRVDPFDGSDRMHRGVDVAAPLGTPIAAAAAGEVIWAGPRGSYGDLVVVRHDADTETRYAHQSRVLVAVGDIVSAGETIGEVGSTGRSTGPPSSLRSAGWW